MQSNIIATYKQRWSIHPRNLVADLIAGLTTAVSSIPDSMASALLAGINPLTGLYTMIIATPIGALFTSSESMHISTTSALSLAVASSLVGMPPDMKLQAVYMLALMVGVIQITLGLLKTGLPGAVCAFFCDDWFLERRCHFDHPGTARRFYRLFEPLFKPGRSGF